jgi:hypothetical protein
MILFATILELSWTNTVFLFFSFAPLSFFQVFAAQIVRFSQRLRASFQAAPAAPDQKSQSHEWCSGFSQFLFELEMSCHYWHIWYKFNAPDFTANQGGNRIDGRVEFPSWTEDMSSIVFSIPKAYWQSIMHILFFNKPFCFSSEMVLL